MTNEFTLDEAALAILAKPEHSKLFTEITRGIEREALRVSHNEAKLSQLDHPKALGSALTHPFITTDFSEALIELVTPPVQSLEELESSLKDLHQFVSQHLDQEVLWPASMPGLIEENGIRLAHYGQSNIAKMKHIYRCGLCHRYGRMMQVIAGIHYNFSLPKALFAAWHQGSSSQLSLSEFINAAYFKLMRNYFRHYWLLIYLFGASPVCSNSSLPPTVPDYLEPYDEQSYYAPYGTSLRMSDLGYNNSSQASIFISRDNLADYVKDLLRVTHQPYPDYASIGLKDDKGEYRQLNTNLLQIENEYYSPIRPKQVTRSGERPALALQERGVEYIEVRALDVNPFCPVGIDMGQAAFIDVFLVFCLLADSASLSQYECQEKAQNLHKIVTEGRRPGLTLGHNGEAISMTTWADRVFAQLERIAKVMDAGVKQAVFLPAVKMQYHKILDSSLTPSAQILAMMGQKQCSFQDLMLEQAQGYAHDYKTHAIEAITQDKLERLVEQSWLDQKQIESTDNVDFDTFLANYFKQGTV